MIYLIPIFPPKLIIPGISQLIKPFCEGTVGGNDWGSCVKPKMKLKRRWWFDLNGVLAYQCPPCPIGCNICSKMEAGDCFAATNAASYMIQLPPSQPQIFSLTYLHQKGMYDPFCGLLDFFAFFFSFARN